MGRFHKIEEIQFAELANNLINLLPKSSQLHNVLRLCLDGSLKKIVPTDIFAYDGIIEGRNAFIVAKQDLSYYNYKSWIICAPEIDSVIEDMFSAFEAVVDWSRENSFNAVHTDVSDQIENLCTKHGKFVGGPCHVYWADKFTPGKNHVVSNGEDEVGNNSTNCDWNITVKGLAVDEARTVVKNWKYAEDGTLGEIEDAIKFVESTGLYTNVDGVTELVSWAYGSIDGSIHALFTIEGQRGKGYGKLVLETISRNLGQRGHYPTTHVEFDNESALQLMERSGFKFSHRMRWVDFRPPK